MSNHDHASESAATEGSNGSVRMWARMPDHAPTATEFGQPSEAAETRRVAECAHAPAHASEEPEAAAAGLDLSPHLRSEAFLSAAMDGWGDAVYRTALSHLRSVPDAEDVFQDVFLRLLADATVFTSDDHLKAWLLRVTVNRCRDLARRRARRPREAADDVQLATIPDGAPSVHAQAFGSAERNAVAEAVAALPDHLREVTHLYYGEECATDEIARIVGCSPVTVRTRLYRARAVLREALEDGGDPDPEPATSTGKGRAQPCAAPSADGPADPARPSLPDRKPATRRESLVAPASKPTW